MSTVRNGLQYSVEHEWITDESPATVGVSEVAVDALGEIVYVDLPEVGATVTAGEVCGEIESTKSVGELYAPVTGTITEINDAVVDDPSLVNAEPFEGGWLIKVEIADGALDGLLDRDAYVALTEG